VIELSLVTDPDARFGNEADVAVRSSPDGARFALVTTRGLVGSNEIESSLWVIDQRTIRKALNGETETSVAPTLIARRTATSNDEVLISDVRWEPQSASILFLARDHGGARRLYRAGITENKTIVALSQDNQDVEQFDFANGTIVYSVATSDPQYETGARAKERSAAQVASEVVTGRSLEELVFPGLTEKWLISSWREVWVIRQNGAQRLVDTTFGRAIRHPGVFNYAVLALSPDGSRVITVAPVAGKWGRTSSGDGGENEGVESEANSLTTPYQYVVVDLTTGRSTPLIDAPLGLSHGYTGVTDVVWSPDGHEVLATGTFLPGELERHGVPCALSIITPSVAVGHATCLMRESGPPDHSPRYVLEHSAAFGPSSRQVVARTVGHRGDVPREVWYEAWGNKWREVHAWSAPIRRDGVSLVIRQGLSDPPAVYARATAHDRWIKIWDPNPQLEARSLGDVSVLRWTDATGYEWSAGLVKPADFAVGKRYPLVIQTHSFNVARFLTDGGYSTAFAARPLASAGILVLQMDLRDTHIGTPQEIPDQLAGFFSALDVLTSQGLIEPSRVGIVGFSRTCLHVEAALIAAPERFAAATIADGTDLGYVEYLLAGNGGLSREAEGERVFGAKPFGAGLQNWIEAAPSFNLDKIHAPVRIEVDSGGAVGLLMMWPRYASLALMSKAVDFIYFPAGTHVLQKPAERLASQQGDVDWLRFWLQGYEDPDPAKVEEYVRWRKLLEVQRSQGGAG
jgi:hypothetical protein